MSGYLWNTLAGRTRLVCVVSYLILMGQQAADAFVHQAPWIVWLGKLLPLMIFVPGIWRDNPRSYIWLCFVSLLYFISLVERVFAQPDDLLSFVGLAAVVMLFCSAMMYVRWRAKTL